MTKNMTRKSLAFGAGLSLVASGFAGLPASAAGVNDGSVTLAPTTGTEYSVLSDQTFSLSANNGTGVEGTGKYMKLLVTDPNSEVALDSGQYVAATASAATFTASSNKVTLTTAAHKFVVGDTITVTGAATMNSAGTVAVAEVTDGTASAKQVSTITIAGAHSEGDIITVGLVATAPVVYTVTAADVTTGTVINNIATNLQAAIIGAPGALYVATNDTADALASITAVANGAKTLNTAVITKVDIANVTDVTITNVATNTISYVSKAGNGDISDTGAGGVPTLTSKGTLHRSVVDSSFIIDTRSDSNTADRLVVLSTSGTETASATVTAWIDDNGNNVIDSTEYSSPVRTLTWIKPSEIVTGISMSPVALDAKLTATVTTAPVLNGEQVIAQDVDWLNVAFTRQDDATVMFGDNGETSSATSVWDDTDKTWTVYVDTDADATTAGSSTVAGSAAASWALVSGINQVGSQGTNEPTKFVVAAGLGGQVTVTTKAAHHYRVGDKLNVVINAATEDAKAASADEDGVVVTSVPSTTSFTYNVLATTLAVAGTADDAVAGLNAGTTVSMVTFGAGVGITDRVFAGTYTAKAYVRTVATGSTLSVGTIAAATGSASIATTGSATVTGNSVTTDVASNQTVKVGTTTVPMTVTAMTAAGVALGAGRTVVVTTEAPVDGGATVGTFKVNGAASATLTTDANGQVTFNVTTNNTTASAQTRVSALVENTVTVGMDLHWDAQAYTLVDYGTTAGTITTNAAIARTILLGGSYSLNLAVEDQWFQAAAADTYRVVVSGSGVTEAIQSLVAGKAVVAIRDAGLTALNGNFTSTVVLQKLTGGVWGATSTHTVTTTLKAAPTVNIGADGSSTYAPGANVSDLSDLVAAKALVEIDQRSSTTVTPAYANAVTVQGSTVNTASSAAVANVYVTISGPSNILFSNDKLAARGSLTLLTDANGKFEVNLYSTSAQTNTVITVTAMGVSNTTKVSFTGVGVGEGTSLVITAPAAVKPATTFQVSAKLTDAYGNAVDTAAGRVKVTYTGSGIVWGTLPTETDSTGSLSFAVLLGSNDSASAVVTVSYDQNGDGDYVDAKDLTTTSTTEINASGVAASVSAAKVNVGSFKGYVALYAKGYKGKKMSAIVAGKWIVVASLATDFERVVRYTGAGYDIVTTIYIDGVSVQSFNVTTK